MNRIDFIRSEEKAYHETFYAQHTLFQQGSWLNKPVKTVMDLLSYIEGTRSPTVLDLGCGVGRNSIPVAERLKRQEGKVVCVDLLESAIEQLKQYSAVYHVEGTIEGIVADISEYVMPPDAFDYIIAVSSLEHIDSEPTLDRVLSDMVIGTRIGGINCIVINSNVEEIDVESHAALPPMMEINLPTGALLAKLKQVYEGWNQLSVLVKPLSFEITRNGKPVSLKTDAITFAVQK